MRSNKRSKIRAAGSTVSAWTAQARGTDEALLAVAGDPHATGEDLAVIVPPYRELGRLAATVAVTVLAHPACPDGLADRLASHPDPEVRLAVVRRGRIGTMAEPILLADPDPSVRAAARSVLSGAPGVLPTPAAE